MGNIELFAVCTVAELLHEILSVCGSRVVRNQHPISWCMARLSNAFSIGRIEYGSSVPDTYGGYWGCGSDSHG